MNETQKDSRKEIRGHAVFLPSNYLFCLAEKIAEEIYSLVMSMHTRTVETGDPRPIELEYNRSRTNEIRAIVRSLSSFDRSYFVGHIRFHFQEMRKARGTEIRWQDYVAKVQAYRQAEREV